MIKRIILFVALPLPIVIFLFLKFFGKNEFDVRVYWNEGVNVAGCKPQPAPYVLPDSALTAWGWTGAKATLIVLNENGIKDNLARVADLFEDGDYSTIKVSDVPNCLLLAGDSSQVVMIDDQKRIRGYYTPTSRKQTDRLAVELRILLKQY
ncbi:MAG TPA: hypothetical protein VF473_03515 [Cyclobacteriaceae bacterium]